MRYGSVCSGIEAASCAWEPLGWEPAWFAEIDVAPALTSTAEANSTDRGVRVVCATGAVTHALRSVGSDASEDGTGRGTPVVPVPYTIEIRGRDGEQQLEYRQDGTANCLRVSNGGRDGMGVGAVAAPMPEWRVRRLTPMECERLQGFPDGWTDIPGAKDGPRYAALGNSMAVPVMRWIGQRIAAVDAILKKAKK
jgi:DNA (cytosine-5)-methyltransferase 1